MANRDAPMGLRPVAHLSGGTHGRYSTNKYHIASGYGSNIFSGDLVKLSGTGREVQLAETATSDNPVIGVFWGCEYRDTNGEVVFKKYWPASTATLNTEAATAWVIDDPDVIFEVQADEDIVAGDIGQGIDFAYTAGSTLTGVSKVEADSSTIGSGSDVLYIYDTVDRADNELGSNNTKILVTINLHAYRNGGSASFGEV